MFPVTVFYETYSVGDFYPNGYVTALSESIGKMSSHLLESFSNGAGTSAGTNIVISGGISVTLPAKLNPALNLLIAQVSAPVTHTRFTKSSYTPATPSLTGTVIFNGSVSGNWTISPYVFNKVPALICQGGIGVSTTDGQGKTIVQQLGIDCPSFSMKLIWDDFTSFYEEMPDPWFVLKRVSGAATASISTQALYGVDNVPGLTEADCYLGLLKLTAKGSTELSSSDDKYSYSGSVFLSYGTRGFIQPVSGGPISFKARLRPSDTITSVDVTRMQIGLKGDLGAKGVNFLNHYGLGFEVNSLANSQVITVLCATPGAVVSVPTGIVFDVSRFFNFEIRTSPFDRKAYFYVNSALVHTQDLTYWPSDKETLLQPAVSHSTSTLNERSLFVDYILTTQRVTRG